MIVKKMKQLIKYAIELDIDYLETFLGYEGDNVLKITTRNKETLEAMEEFLKNIDLKYKTDFDISAGTSGGHVIYIGVEDPSLFKLKKD
ncbi:hypothetical protein [Sulfurimonas microaerophilic]|uniref:hypothetical protein n=1 Tax=Sulfurimonas microaerophilic TaxID=3058392 RepID=UPI0027146DB2|nr:hypothetical protein [Sulfurimonas sp. hsl 1-7]